MAPTILLQAALLISCAPSADTWQEPASASADGVGAAALPALQLVEVAKGFRSPTFMCSDPSNAERWFILQKEGRLRFLEAGVIREQDFIDLSERVSTSSEQGLLGMAFHPKFPEKPWVFLNYTNLDGATVVARFDVDTKAWAADPSSEKILLTIDQPWANHNGGMIAFSPKDGYLYIGMGDGGAGGDPKGAGQDGQNLLGKMLRIDVDVEGDTPYGIPKDNPFVGISDFRDEIWAYGVRNPWRFCFDPLNGDMYIGDVGQNAWEEISYQAGSSKGGENYGWKILEGNHKFDKKVTEVGTDLVPPIHEYSQGGKSGHCSVTGGYVYRGSAIPALDGVYFYGDYCSGGVGSFRVADGKQVGRVNHSDNFNINRKLATLVSFGVDAAGELYLLTMSGALYRVEARPVTDPGAGTD
ncbi:MAG: PQQ-dependent sugar dehydrogenase [Planctomycetes bacterium]|nr:PQQ-dependent sugar dehydrogenase [Planctomycetota bacterium]MCP4770891.1 PQQ-dependent sugar dehydrogenase [Planctomycetota bacterium]MCP4862284.1 PQQ-dependent sugar dehydrogenase [Planctomycetota bacterium]